MQQLVLILMGSFGILNYFTSSVGKVWANARVPTIQEQLNSNMILLFSCSNRYEPHHSGRFSRHICGLVVEHLVDRWPRLRS
jgi:hypothetical protein